MDMVLCSLARNGNVIRYTYMRMVVGYPQREHTTHWGMYGYMWLRCTVYIYIYYMHYWVAGRGVYIIKGARGGVRAPGTRIAVVPFSRKSEIKRHFPSMFSNALWHYRALQIKE